ncbi:hypothetical protein IAT38_001099 [Cryptococcus sp. DSM 104549]
MPKRPSLASARSALNPRAKLVTAEPVSTENSDTKPTFTSLRRTTRASASGAVKLKDGSPPPLRTSKLNIAKYEYQPSTPSPRKKPRLEAVAGASDVKPKVEPGTGSPATPRSAKKPMPQAALAKPHPAPAKWEEQYRLIERMRKGIVAPVDDMGCERPRTNIENDPKTFRFHILISLMLSSQTKDAITSAAVTSLHETLPGGLTAESLSAAPLEAVQECINKVGFWRRKAEYIQEAARTLLAKEGEEKGDVPNTLEGLCALKGVGPKMAFLALQCAWDINAGIGVDVHVHRITNRLKWHRPPTTTPEGTRLNLQSWLPQHLHKPINPLLVGFGQVICLPVGPRCDICLLGEQKICPSRVGGVKAQGRKAVVYDFTGEEDGVKVGEWDWRRDRKSGEGEEGVKVEAKVEVGYEGLERMKDKPEEEGVGEAPVKLEQAEVDAEVAKPGLNEEQVLGILDRVDGTTEIGAKPRVKTEEEW